MDIADLMLVVAHPDDEILWFAGILAQVARLVICYGQSDRVAAHGPARRRALSRFPLKQMRFLDQDQPGRVEPAREADLQAALAAQLRPDLKGLKGIVSHNPWGEYGHDDHRRVHRVAAGLAAEQGLEHWVSAYVGPQTQTECARILAGARVQSQTHAVDPALVAPIRDLYLAEECWTWPDTWTWPAQDHFLRLTSAPTEPDAGPAQAVPLTFIRL